MQTDPSRIITMKKLIIALDGSTTLVEVPDVVLPAKQHVVTYSKYKLLTAIHAAGKSAEFFSFIDALPRFQQEAWYAANELKSNDPLMIGLLPALPAALGVTQETINTVLARSTV